MRYIVSMLLHWGNPPPFCTFYNCRGSLFAKYIKRQIWSVAVPFSLFLTHFHLKKVKERLRPMQGGVTIFHYMVWILQFSGTMVWDTSSMIFVPEAGIRLIETFNHYLWKMVRPLVGNTCGIFPTSRTEWQIFFWYLGHLWLQYKLNYCSPNISFESWS